MGSDLVRACVFCAGLLFATEASTWPGLSGDLGVTYATAARSTDRPGGRDLSDVTPKFLSIGVGGAKPPEGELGAGTPASEFRLRVALAPSHDEQEMTPFSTSNVTATGTGRYENFALGARYAIAPRDSVELAWSRRTHKGTDLVNLGGERFVLGEERTLSAERLEGGIGWRHRWRDLEAAVSGRWVKPSGSVNTPALFVLAGSGIWGGGVEVKARRGRWTLFASGERAAGSIDLHEENAPDFRGRDVRAPALLESARAGALYEAARVEASIAGSWDRSRLPFVAFAPLGTETVAFEQGYHPDSTTREYAGEAALRYRVSRGVRVGALLRLSYGTETVALTDPTGALPDRRLDVHRSGTFGSGLSKRLGSPQVTLRLGADFRLDTSR